jgi:hypothetical protein
VKPLTLEERLRSLSLEARQLLTRAENARTRQAEARSVVSDEQMLLRGPDKDALAISPNYRRMESSGWFDLAPGSRSPNPEG